MTEVWAALKPFVTGSLSGSFATCCIQPMDMVKVRIQLGAAEGGATSPLVIASKMLKEEGPMSMYKGLSAGLTRQVIYTGTRLGLYDVLCEKVKSAEEKTMPMWKTAVCALTAGGIAAIVGNPADLALIRMQADSMLPVAERRGYRHVGHAMISILRTDGPAGLLKGWMPTATRAMGLNLGMLAGNTQAKRFLTDFCGVEKGSNLQVFGASAIAGFLASALSLPFDFVKTQIQKMKPDPVTGKLPYSGPLDCAAQQFKIGGFPRFYAGFPTYYFRIAPHAMITLVAQDNVKKIWKKYNL